MKIVGIWWQKEENEKISNNSGDPSGDYDGISDRFSIYIMKIKIEQTTTSEVEIKLPYYSKDEAHFYKIISETSAIQICKFCNIGIQRGEIFVKFAIGVGQKVITADEFNQAYEDMLHKLAE